MNGPADDWGQWVVLAVLVACCYLAWDMLYYRRLMATGKVPLAALFVLMLLMALAFGLFRLLMWLAGARLQ